MEVLTPKRSKTYTTTKYKHKESHQPKFKFRWLLFLLVILGFTIALVYGLREQPFIIQQPDGSYALADWRLEKLAEEIISIQRKPRGDRAEQYVLLARVDGWYPCYSCPNSGTIFLKAREVWKYGKTIHTKEKRYPGDYLDNRNLLYFTEYVGPEVECLILEKRKIYNYAIHPQNLARPFQLIRPPGNKIDR